MTEDRMASGITIAATDAEILATSDLIVQLHPHLGQVQPAEYLQRVRRQQEETGFQLAILRHAGEIVSVAGFRFCRSLGWGPYLYLDDLVTVEGRRSRGAGKVMFAWLVEKARHNATFGWTVHSIARAPIGSICANEWTLPASTSGWPSTNRAPEYHRTPTGRRKGESTP